MQWSAVINPASRISTFPSLCPPIAFVRSIRPPLFRGVVCVCRTCLPLKNHCQLGKKPIINHRRILPPPPSRAVSVVYSLRTAKAMMMAWYPNPLQLTPAVILGVWCVSPQQETLVDLLMPFCEYQNERSASWYGHQTSENLEKLLNVVVLVLSSSLATQLAPVVLLLQPLLVLQRIHHHADCVFVQRGHAGLVHLLLQFAHHLHTVRHDGSMEGRNERKVPFLIDVEGLLLFEHVLYLSTRYIYE